MRDGLVVQSKYAQHHWSHGLRSPLADNSEYAVINFGLSMIIISHEPKGYVNYAIYKRWSVRNNSSLVAPSIMSFEGDITPYFMIPRIPLHFICYPNQRCLAFYICEPVS